MKYTNTKKLQAQKMEITPAIIEKLFDDCNTLYFENKLPKIPITTINSTEINGNFIYDIDFDNATLTNMYIQINVANKRTRDKLINTMVHEMIHYLVATELSQDELKKAIWYFKDNQLDLFNKIMYSGEYAHTNKWLDYAKTINNKYSLNVQLK